MVIIAVVIIFAASSGLKVTVNLTGTDNKDIPVRVTGGVAPKTFNGDREAERPVVHTVAIENLDGDVLKFKLLDYGRGFPEVIDQGTRDSELAMLVIEGDSVADDKDEKTTAGTPTAVELDGVRLTVSVDDGKAAEDVLAVRSDYYATPRYSIKVEDQKIKYDLGKGPVQIATIAGGEKGKALEVRFSTKVGADPITAVLRNVTYVNSKDSKTGTNGERKLTFALRAKNCEEAKTEATVNVTGGVESSSDLISTGNNKTARNDAANPNNIAPLLSGLTDEVTYTPGSPAPDVRLDTNNDASVYDSDSQDFNGGELVVSIYDGLISGEDVLGIRDEGSGTGRISLSPTNWNVSYDDGRGAKVIGTFSGGENGDDLKIKFNSEYATLLAVTQLLKNITYKNKEEKAPTTKARTIRFTLSDGDGGFGDGKSTPQDITVKFKSDATVASSGEEVPKPKASGGGFLADIVGDATNDQEKKSNKSKKKPRR
jgi:hypothetical protein